MKIFIFEDTAEEAEKAKTAVEAAGHEAVIVSAVLRLALSNEELVSTKTATKEETPPPGPMGLLIFQMNQEAAKEPTFIVNRERQIARDNIWMTMKEIVSLQSSGESVGIVTDLMFRLKEGELTPSGLLVMAHAVSHSIPVCICTDCGHHGEGAAGFIYVGYIKSVGNDSAFGFSPNKDWDEAVEIVSKM